MGERNLEARIDAALDELIRRVKAGSTGISIASARQAVHDVVFHGIDQKFDKCLCGKHQNLCTCHRKKDKP